MSGAAVTNCTQLLLARAATLNITLNLAGICSGKVTSRGKADLQEALPGRRIRSFQLQLMSETPP